MSFAQYLHDLHDDIRRQIAVSNVNNKSTINLHKRLQEFAVGDKVMVRVRPKRFPSGTVNARCRSVQSFEEVWFQCLWA